MSNINYLRVILINKCNLNCFFCHDEGITTSLTFNLKSNDLLRILCLLINCGIKKIKFLGGEPTLYDELPYIIRFLKERFNFLDVSMVTNGVVSKDKVFEYVTSGIDRINVSLHGFDFGIFKAITRGTEKQLNNTFLTIDLLKKIGKLGKVNYVLLKNTNENEFFKVVNFAIKKGIVIDVLNYLGTNKEMIDKYYYSFEEIIKIIKKRFKIISIIEYTNKFSLPSTRIILKNGGALNLKTTKLNNMSYLKSCDNCNVKKYCIEGISAIRLTPEGVIKPCLFREDNLFNLYDMTLKYDEKTVLEMLKLYLENL